MSEQKQYTLKPKTAAESAIVDGCRGHVYIKDVTRGMDGVFVWVDPMAYAMFGNTLASHLQGIAGATRVMVCEASQ